MLETPHVTRTTDVTMAAIHVTVPRSRIQEVMGPGIEEVMRVVMGQGLTPTGPWFTHHFRMTGEEFDFEICLPLSAPVQPSGRVKPGVLKGARVAQVVYRGGYEGLGAAWGEFEEWIKAEGHRMAPDLWERYVVGPESGSDASAWRTELNRPLVTP